MNPAPFVFHWPVDESGFVFDEMHGEPEDSEYVLTFFPTTGTSDLDTVNCRLGQQPEWPVFIAPLQLSHPLDDLQFPSAPIIPASATLCPTQLHSPSPETKFSCEYCNRAFDRAHDLKRHSRTHTGETPYKCYGCGKSFIRTEPRQRHWERDRECKERHTRTAKLTPEEVRRRRREEKHSKKKTGDLAVYEETLSTVSS